ncbi:hypothetical protein B0H14DRAFT_2565150 [Mycena olivaceomarginata]|nr:hypothetical protein B0H14DRAFT_2565150 [Mycena olivaceomarginata]
MRPPLAQSNYPELGPGQQRENLKGQLRYPRAATPDPTLQEQNLTTSSPEKRHPTTSSSVNQDDRAERNRIATQNSRDRRKAQFAYLERRVRGVSKLRRKSYARGRKTDGLMPYHRAAVRGNGIRWRRVPWSPVLNPTVSRLEQFLSSCAWEQNVTSRVSLKSYTQGLKKKSSRTVRCPQKWFSDHSAVTQASYFNSRRCYLFWHAADLAQLSTGRNAAQSSPNFITYLWFSIQATVDPQSITRSSSHHNFIPAPSPLGSLSTTPYDDPFQSSMLPGLAPTISESDLDGLAPESFLSRRQRTSTYNKIHGVLADLRRDRISPVDLLIQVLDPNDLAYDRYRGSLYRDESNKLMQLLDTIMADQIVPGIAVVTPDFIENWSLDEEVDHSPFLTRILTAAAQTERAKLHNKIKRPEKMVQVVTRQLLYLFSNNCLAFQAEFGLFLWSTGCARQAIDALYRCGLSVAYDSVLNLVESLGEHCNTNARGAAGPAKVTSGPFAVLYGLRNAKWEHMLIAPIMKRYRASTGLQFNRDIRPDLDHLRTFHDQLVVHIIDRLFAYNEGFERVAKQPSLKHRTIRAIPVGWKTPQFRLALPRPKKQQHVEICCFTMSFISTSSGLTNSRIRSAQVLRSKDVNAWERREIFQLGFGLFHLCLNLVWAVLHTHRGSVNELGSLTYFFTLMEKTRLGNDQPDYHSLLAALTQVLDGLLLNDCGSVESNPSLETLRDIASCIVNDYSTPMNTSSHTAEESSSDSESEESESSSEAGNCSTPKASTPQSMDPEDDPAHHNIRLLTRDLLMVAVLVRAISDGDIGRVEVLLSHLAFMFRGSGCNKDIMRDNMIICISGNGPGHCMAVDLNTEHLIGYLKTLLQAKGMDSTWDRLGNISAAIVHLRAVKKKISAALKGAHQRTGHTTPSTALLVWRVQQKVSSEKLQDFDAARTNNPRGKLTVDVLKVGEAKLKSSTLATFNKKILAMIEGFGCEDEEDECPPMTYGTASLPDDWI